MSFITSTILILCTAIQLSGSEFRVIRGLLTDDRGEILIGATIFEYGNMMNFVLSDVNGEFEIKIPKQEEVVLRITY
ncbi:MAG TPA: hypothetical protein ENK75_00105 [Saprospiraceae bacterium]|nr:hypothetical protein [Saprospiraceae bacterium]